MSDASAPDPRLRTPDVRAPATARDDPRLGHLLGSALADEEQPRAVIVGFPTDVGVRRNGGRPGAAAAPRAIRDVLYRLTPGGDDDRALAAFLARTRDLGDVITGDDLEGDQALLGEIIAPWIGRGVLVVVLGGGHETAFGHFLGHVRSGAEASILNWDAHADVRPLADGRAHSGSPFRQALDHGRGCRRYTVAGLQPHAVAPEHASWVMAHGGECIWRGSIDAEMVPALYDRVMPTLVSFDLDAADQASAPGVSAPSTGGLDVRTWLDAAEWAGRSASVRSCDVVELCPPLDRDAQTARLAALTVWRILRGRARREQAAV